MADEREAGETVATESLQAPATVGPPIEFDRKGRPMLFCPHCKFKAGARGYFARHLRKAHGVRQRASRRKLAAPDKPAASRKKRSGDQADVREAFEAGIAAMVAQGELVATCCAGLKAILEKAKMLRVEYIRVRTELRKLREASEEMKG